ncbi:MAG: UDP-3-O-[3-hydroxymyristoyl] N-acetylglucosamine deacetylase [candidate division SR1 bacterium CG_4_9_14_3_um_filter_40_9]|nr:MAG: UDP-3-O-[3-hydroxymyristoyl] N-acetylglucosamine deacetylase [candidate division SR1 bacterium CG_4_9_14_3_um_filter_40_9]
MQKTIKKSITYSGIGLHTGHKAHLCLRPGLSDTGIIFFRTDMPDSICVPARINFIDNTHRGVSLRHDLTEIKTVEHILAAINGLGIDNLIIEVSAPEIPVGDGSSQVFVELLKEAEIICQDEYESKTSIKILSPIWVSTENSHIVVLPSEDYKISFTLCLEDSFVGSQFASFSISPEIFEQEIASARTFGFLKEVEQLKKQGLAMGGSLFNTVVIGEDNFLNSLRFKDELVRHKILDMIGDLSLIGRPIQGHVIAVKSGHELNLNLARKILGGGIPCSNRTGVFINQVY